MPLILIAGTIVAKAKAEIFPTSDRPRCEVRIKVEGDGSAVIYRVIGFDDQTAELETCCKIHFAGFSEKRPSRVLPTMTEMTVMLLRGQMDDPATSRRIFPPRCACVTEFVRK